MSIRQRLYPNLDNNTILLMHCTDARFVYNLGLEQRNLKAGEVVLAVSSAWRNTLDEVALTSRLWR